MHDASRVSHASITRRSKRNAMKIERRAEHAPRPFFAAIRLVQYSRRRPLIDAFPTPQ
jgi:hypothetical protein